MGDRGRAPELWRFVPLAAYVRPEAPVGSRAARAWESFRGMVRRSVGAGESPARQEQDLSRLPEVRLAHLVHPIDWSHASRALDRELAAHTAPQGPGVSFVIGQPHCGHAEIVQGWAARHGARVLEAPDSHEILAGGGRWLEDWRPVDGPWVLPRLERCFLRNAAGLSLVRRLLETVTDGRAGEGVIGCDSWAWTYLGRVWPVSQPRVLTLQAFDGEALSALFARLALSPRSRRLRFCNAHSGRETLAVPREGDAVGEQILALAAHCRGNPGVARSYWRNCLRAEPEDADEGTDDEPAQVVSGEAADGGAAAAPGGRQEVVWVSAHLDDPELPLEGADDVALLLHALLLHGGLPEEAFEAVLPMALPQAMAVVLRLRQRGVLERREGRWTVAALAYVPVRQWLRGRDYLIDAF